MAVDSVGDIYIADTSNHVVWEVVEGTTATSLGITAGDIVHHRGQQHWRIYAAMEDWPASRSSIFPRAWRWIRPATFTLPIPQNHVIREITATNGIINTIVGGIATVSS